MCDLEGIGAKSVCNLIRSSVWARMCRKERKGKGYDKIFLISEIDSNEPYRKGYFIVYWKVGANVDS